VLLILFTAMRQLTEKLEAYRIALFHTWANAGIQLPQSLSASAAVPSCNCAMLTNEI